MKRKEDGAGAVGKRTSFMLLLTEHGERHSPHPPPFPTHSHHLPIRNNWMHYSNSPAPSAGRSCVYPSTYCQHYLLFAHGSPARRCRVRIRPESLCRRQQPRSNNIHPHPHSHPCRQASLPAMCHVTGVCISSIGFPTPDAFAPVRHRQPLACHSLSIPPPIEAPHSQPVTLHCHVLQHRRRRRPCLAPEYTPVR